MKAWARKWCCSRHPMQTNLNAETRRTQRSAEPELLRLPLRPLRLCVEAFARAACHSPIAVWLLLNVASAHAQQSESQGWLAIAPHFQPPPEFTGQFGRYRSPLLF